jgi:hypothetical protein
LNVNRFDSLDRIRHVPFEACRFDHVTEFAEPQHSSSLSFLDDVEPAAQPEQEGGSKQQSEAGARTAQGRAELTAAISRRLTTATALGEHAVQTAIEISPEFIKVRGAVIAATGALLTGTLIVLTG